MLFSWHCSQLQGIGGEDDLHEAVLASEGSQVRHSGAGLRAQVGPEQAGLRLDG